MSTEIDTGIRALVERVHEQFGGSKCSVSVSFHRGQSKPIWFVHAKASGLCSHGDSFKETCETFRKEHGLKTHPQLAAELREQAERLLASAKELDPSTP